MTTERTEADARANLHFYLVGVVASGVPEKVYDGIMELADAIEAEARAPLVTALQPAYDLIMLLAFAKPEAAEGVPKTFAVLDELRVALRENQP